MCHCTSPRQASPTRRDLLIGLGATAGAALVAGPLAAQTTPQNAITPDAALKRIMDGNARYVAGQARRRDFSAGRAARAKSQAPVAAILGCADSRVSPEIVFDEGPGDLFVVRVAGNIASVNGVASLEYSVKFLGSPLIMVLGHSNCGAVGAAIKVEKSNAELPGHLPELINTIKPAVRAAAAKKPANLLDAAIRENVRLTAAGLSANDPIIAPMVKAGRVRVVGAVYELATGKVSLL